MDVTVPVTRRLLLGRFGASGVVMATFLLNGGAWAASRKSHAAHPQHHPGPAARKKLPVVMLDPGHGGKDPGAIGVSGTHEKKITLATAHELRKLLESSGKYRVEMTRTRDVFIPLDDRVAKARARGALLFVSMHADALPDHSVRGASVYTLAATASDAQTAALARRENSADRYVGAHWRDASPEVSQILASLVRRETRTGSIRIARSLVTQLDRDLPMLQNPSRHASFAVLKAADIPSVLVEMGFMSNPKDEAALTRAAHRRMVATAMKRAIDTYFVATGQSAEADRTAQDAG